MSYNTTLDQRANAIDSMLGESVEMEETLERNGDLFSQLSSMIAAVQSESSHLESIKSQIEEIDNIKEQLNAASQTIASLEQENVGLKTAMLSLQDTVEQTKKSKVSLM